MIHEIYGATADQLYVELLWSLRLNGIHEQTRNGAARVIDGIASWTLKDPTKRIVFNPTRNANPFFHVMETCWMFAGRMDVNYLLHFNKNMEKYADNDSIQAAYGHRWRKNFGVDQLVYVVKKLREDPTTRQAVIMMWDPIIDTRGFKDKACNTQMIFRNRRGRLDCLVTNRSNDLVWGALGSNIVHLTMAHEFIALAAGLELGRYTVVSNNLHIYEQHYPLMQFIVDPNVDYDQHVPLLRHKDEADQFLKDCEYVCEGLRLDDDVNTYWVTHVAQPISDLWDWWKENKTMNYDKLNKIADANWRHACQEWILRKLK